MGQRVINVEKLIAKIQNEPDKVAIPKLTKKANELVSQDITTPPFGKAKGVTMLGNEIVRRALRHLKPGGQT